MRPITHLIIHHSASARTTTVKDIREWHRARGWTDIGYHWVIDGEGHIRQGRPWEQIGAHVKGHNRNSFGVCVVGDNTRPDRRWTQTQAASLGFLVDAVRVFYPKIQVLGHRDTGAATDCPGLDIHQLREHGWVLADVL